MTWIRQDPDARKDYGFDWELQDGETIATSTWQAVGLTTDTPSKTDTSTTVWVSGGTAGGRYKVTNRVVTSLGRSDDRTLHFMIENT
jgi:hypothetical protein